MKQLLVLGLFVFLSILKLHNYDRNPYPVHGEEQAYGWAGIYQIETGQPVSWSSLNYPPEYKFFDGKIGQGSLSYSTTLWKPWLDEPPLFSLMSGGSAHLYGDNRQDVLPASHLRIPTVLASLLTMLLIYLIGNSYFSYKVGMLGMLIYGTSPIFVFASRLAVPENIIALIYVLSALIILRYLSKPAIWQPIFLGVLSATAGLLKPTGFFIAFLMIFFTIFKKKPRHALIIFFITLLGVLVYAYFGYTLNWELFKHIVSVQGTRFAGWTGLVHILVSPAADVEITMDGWYVFSLLSSLVLVFTSKKSSPQWVLSMFFVFWLLVATLSGTEQDLLPWYRYPFFPFIALLGALGLSKVYQKADFFSVSIVLGTLLSSRWLLSNEFRPTTSTIAFRLIFLLASIPPLLHIISPKQLFIKLSRLIIVATLVIGVYLNAVYVYNTFEVRCQSKSCPIGKSTKFSELNFPFIWRFFILKDSTDMLTTKRPIL